MPKASNVVLDDGDAFPALTMSVGDGSISLPGDVSGSWGVLLFYRGHW